MKNKIITDDDKIEKLNKLMFDLNKSKCDSNNSSKLGNEKDEDIHSFFRFDYTKMMIESMRLKEEDKPKLMCKESLNNIIMLELNGEYVDSKCNISINTYKQIERYTLIANKLKKITNDIESKVQIINQRILRDHFESDKI